MLGKVQSHRSPGLTCPIAHSRTVGTGILAGIGASPSGSVTVFCTMYMHSTAVSSGCWLMLESFPITFNLIFGNGSCPGITGHTVSLVGLSRVPLSLACW